MRFTKVPFGLAVLSLSHLALASHKLEPISVEALESSHVISPDDHHAPVTGGDTARLLEHTPGVSLQGAGGMSSLPMIHGMGSDRVNIKIDQAQITSSCPNHMNPSFTYIDPSKVGSIKTLAGITPVGDGGDSIGGSIIVKSKMMEFSMDDSVRKELGVRTFFRSNNENQGAGLNAGVASKKTSFAYSGFDEKANNYRDGKGKRLRSTLYSQNNQTLTFGRKLRDGTLSLKYGRAVVPYQGFVNQYMDSVDNVANSVNLRYEGSMGPAFIESAVFHQHTNHLMDQLRSQRDGRMPMYTRSDETGYNVKATFSLDHHHSLRVGSDFARYHLDDWWTPVTGTMMMAPGNFENIDGGKRDRVGLFTELSSEWTHKVSTHLGLRTDMVNMNTGKVQGYNTTNNLPQDAAAFNARSRSKRDQNYDVTLLTEIQASNTTDIEVGFARKTRSPNLYERYAWAGSVTNPATSGAAAMDMWMVNWFGDGNGYVGDVGLKPEVAHTLSSTLTLHDPLSKDWRFKLTPYYTQIENFIETDLIGSRPAMNSNFLKFANHDAVIFGADSSFEGRLLRSSDLGELSFRLSAGYTRGYRKDGLSNLYNLKPLNGTVMLIHEMKKLTSSLSIEMVKSKEQVNRLRLEEETAGYALLGVGTSYQFTKLVRFDFNISNLLDHKYQLPLGGIDLVNETSARHQAVMGMGRSFNTALNWNFF